MSDPRPRPASTVRLPPPSGDELTRLAEKYDEMAALRRAKHRGEPDASRAVYRRLASRFPGALNELDTLTLRELDERAAALRRAASVGPLEAWMAWLDGYHRLMRAALVIKARGRGTSRHDEPRPDLVREVLDSTNVGIDEDFIQLVAHPPDGRLVVAIFGCLAQHFEVSADLIWTTLFPRRRARRPAGSCLIDDVPEDGSTV